MLQLIKRLLKDRRGNALAIAAAALPLVIGSAGLATDTIQWVTWKRQLQRAADSGALAGVHTIVRDQGARANVANSVDRDLTLNNHVGIVTARAVGQPASGTYASDPYAVEVTLSVRKKLGFSSLFMSEPPTVTAKAIATVVAYGKYCVISLENTTETGLEFTGNANVDLGCGMATNSIGPLAVDAGGSSSIYASPISAVGGISESGNFASGTTLQPYSMKQKDPFADVDPISPSGACNPNLVVNVNAATNISVPGGASYACYNGMNINGTLRLAPGIYVIDGGDFRVGGQAKISCNGCTIILTNRSSGASPQIGRVDIQGSPDINMTATTSGEYAGILFYQDRRAQDSTGENYVNHINGSSQSSFQGAFYFPSQQVFFNGTAGMDTECVQLVGRRVNFSGTTEISNTCPANSGALSFDGSMIRLVA